MKLNLIHLSGAGNTFSIAFENELTRQISNRSEFVKQVCSQNKTDGFIFLDWLSKHDLTFQWDFYNNDGSAAEMCGNATRCVGFYVHHLIDRQAPRFSLKTIAGLMQVRVLENDQYEVVMTKPEFFEHAEYFWCDTGVPHIIWPIQDFNQFSNLKEECRKLRFRADFQPRGTNVTLVQHTDKPEYLKAVSYERGVEDFTQACGTGAMAAAFYNFKKFNISETFVEMPGGLLKMNLQNIEKPTMTGPAIKLGESLYEK